MSDDKKDLGMYRMWLPLTRQGDDFQMCLDNANGDVAKGFLALSNLYTECASMCKRAAGVALENPGFEAVGDNYSIYIDAPQAPTAPLVAEGVFEQLEEEIEDEDDDNWDEDKEEEPTDSNKCTGAFLLAGWPIPGWDDES